MRKAVCTSLVPIQLLHSWLNHCSDDTFIAQITHNKKTNLTEVFDAGAKRCCSGQKLLNESSCDVESFRNIPDRSLFPEAVEHQRQIKPIHRKLIDHLLTKPLPLITTWVSPNICYELLFIWRNSLIGVHDKKCKCFNKIRLSTQAYSNFRFAVILKCLVIQIQSSMASSSDTFDIVFQWPYLHCHKAIKKRIAMGKVFTKRKALLKWRIKWSHGETHTCNSFQRPHFSQQNERRPK